MGLSIHLEDERCVELDYLVDPKNILHDVLPSQTDTSFVCLRFIDWYGNTVFNSLQFGYVIEEFERIKQSSSDPEAIELMTSIIRLVERALREHHSYVRFVGD
jgi:hypothetical protein